MITEQQRFNYILTVAAKSGMTMEQIIKREIDDWENSPVRREMLIGERYYRNDMDQAEIETRGTKRKTNMVNGFVRKLVKQKTDYLLSKPFSVKTDNQQYLKLLNEVFDKQFRRKLKNLGTQAINKAIAWLQPYILDGKIAFAVIPSEEVIPLWADSAHTALDGVIRVYICEEYRGIIKEYVKHVEFWDRTGVKRYIYSDGGLLPDVERGDDAHLYINGQPYNWERVPFVPFKYNDDELPLIHGIKESVDDYNKQKSIVSNLLQDIPNFIYVLKNYGGAELAEFLDDLRASNAIKVDNDGGVDKLQADIDTTAYEAYQSANRKDIYEFGRGVDTQNEDLGNTSGVAISYRYEDLNLDCNDLDMEFSAAMDDVIWFVDRYFIMTGKGDYTNESVEIVFSRNMIINEGEKIQKCRDSMDAISRRTALANHPWVTDVDKELEQIAKEAREYEAQQKQAFGMVNNTPPNGGGAADEE